jgi:hypothetical protein
VIVSGAELGIPWVVVGTKADKLVASDAEVATVVAARGGVVDTGVVRDELTRRKTTNPDWALCASLASPSDVCIFNLDCGCGR